MNKKYLLYAILPVMLCATIGGVVLADSTVTKTNPMSGLVAVIAQKFNLNVSDVQAVFDEQKTKMGAERETNKADMQAEMQQKFADELKQAVTDGKLTQAQADLILAKKAELDAQKPSINVAPKDRTQTSKTKEEMESEMKTRQAEMKAKQDALKQWATDNGIPEEYLRLLGGECMGGHGGHGGPGGNGWFPEGPNSGKPDAGAGESFSN